MITRRHVLTGAAAAAVMVATVVESATPVRFMWLTPELVDDYGMRDKTVEWHDRSGLWLVDTHK